MGHGKLYHSCLVVGARGGKVLLTNYSSHSNSVKWVIWSEVKRMGGYYDDPNQSLPRKIYRTDPESTKRPVKSIKKTYR